jgi:hypothetical protein
MATNLQPLFDRASGGSWREKNCHLFASDASFRWFFRHHKAHLVSSGAVVYLAGRWMGVEPTLTDTMIEIGHACAALKTVAA